MLCVVAVRAPVVHAAVLVLPLPASATALQPAIETPPSMKFTAPLGAKPLTAAMNVTFVPTVDGFSELATLAALAAWLTTCDSAALFELALPASPP